MIHLLLVLTLSTSTVIAQERISLEIPVKCQIGTECFIQNYADIDPTAGYRDYTCGSLSYDGHDGTDFRPRTYDQVKEGIPVLAAADGLVRAVRDGMEDRSIRDNNAPDVKDRECGNGVAITHSSGWETQYCHMRRGSIQVQKNQPVKAGQPLGLVGLSGSTEFPHLHLTVRQGKTPIDPFTGKAVPDKRKKEESFQCASQKSANSLWSNQAAVALEYAPTILLQAGFTDKEPKAEDMRRESSKLEKLEKNAPVLAFLADIAGIQPGDVLLLQILSPDGKILASKQKDFDKPMAQFFYFIGKRNAGFDLTPGTYTGKVTLYREANGTRTEVIRYDTTLAIP